MKMVEEMEKLQQENAGSIILVKNGIFFVAIGKDALTLHDEIGLKLTCMKPELCKVGFLVKNVEEENNCLGCSKCENRKETEKDILERVKKLGMTK